MLIHRMEGFFFVSFWGHQESVGMALQGAYHPMRHLPVSDMWDGRIGVTFRF